MSAFKQGIGRRDLLKMGAAIPAFSMSGSLAWGKDPLILANWGGDGDKGMKQAFAAPYENATGNPVVTDSSGPSTGKVKAMVQSGKVTWDVCDATAALCLELGEAGLLEEIDYNVISPSLTLPKFKYKWGVGSYAYSSIIAFDSTKFKDKKPDNWADFWNVKDFPGRRLLRSDLPAMLEAALMADGVPPEKVYPIDVKRAFAKIREIKEHCLFWKTAAESAQFIRTGEVVMANMWNTRASPIQRETNGRISLTWNQGILQPAVWVVPKGNPGGREAAMQLIKFMQQPEQSINFCRVILGGPTNPQAAAQLPADLRPLVPTAPENIGKQIPIDAEWYAKNYATLLPQYLDLIS